MPDRYFLDISFVIALINEKDQYHKNALELSYYMESFHLITTEAILLEIGNALVKHYKTYAIEIIEIIRNEPNIEVISVDKTWLERGFNL